MRNFSINTELLQHIHFRATFSPPYFNIGLQLKEFSIFDFTFTLHKNKTT